LPLALTYTSSSPPSSAATVPALNNSTYSSDPAAPPVTTSPITSPVEGGQSTAETSPPGRHRTMSRNSDSDTRRDIR